ncbi:CLUMA_CG016363, isoform A, partial [Clunio marinus]
IFYKHLYSFILFYKHLYSFIINQILILFLKRKEENPKKNFILKIQKK